MTVPAAPWSTQPLREMVPRIYPEG